MQLIAGDCLDVMSGIANDSIDMIFCDLPYGTTYAAWDKPLPIHELWQQYRRITKDNAAIVLTAVQPFTSLLVCSQIEMFRCEWIWDKVNASNFANANRQPMKNHESVLVFSKKPTRYFPVKTAGRPNHRQGTNAKDNRSETRLIHQRTVDDLSGLKFPKTIQVFPKHSSQCGLHPTQKPVALMEYFIQTYSLPGETVLDNCMGSGSTAIACINTGRNFIGVEKETHYYGIAENRVAEHTKVGCSSG